MRTSKSLSRKQVDSPEVGARVHTALALVRGVVRQMDKRQTLHASRDDMRSFGNEGALVAGRTMVTPEHVQAVFPSVVEHRIEQRDSGPAAAHRLLEAVPVP